MSLLKIVGRNLLVPLLALVGATSVFAQCETMVEVGSWRYGDAGAVALAGERVYHGSGDYLIISDLSAEEPLAELDLGGRIGFLRVVGTTVAALVDGSLAVVDASDPLAPVQTATLPALGTIVGMELDGSLLITVQRDGLMQAVELSDPYHPQTTAFVWVYSGAYRLAVQDGLAVVVYGDEYVSVVDVSNEDILWDLGAQQLAGTLVDVVLSGGEAVGVGSSGLIYRYDITDPDAWALLDSASVDDGPTAVESFQDEILIQTQWSGLHRLVWNTGGAALETLTDDPSFGWVQLSLDSPRIAYADRNRGVSVFDAADLQDVTLIRSFPSQALAGGLVVHGSHLIAGSSVGGLSVLDGSDPTAPVGAGRLEADWVVREMDLDGDLLYVIDTNRGLAVVDVSDPETPVQVGGMTFDSGVSQLAVADGLAYVMEWSEGLHIIDVSDPADPVLLNTYGIQGFGLAAEGRTVTMLNSGVLVFDMTDPLAPGLVGPIDMGGLEADIAMQGGYAYVPVDQVGVGVLDVRDPAQPVVAGMTETDGAMAELYTMAGSLTTVYGGGRVRVFSLADPIAPVLADCVTVGPFSGLVTAADDLVYLWNAYDGLTVYRASNVVATEDDDGQAPALLTGRTLTASPNPFNPATLIAFELAVPGRVELTVHDMLGRRVRTLVSDAREAGRHEVLWDGGGARGERAASGVYFLRLATDAGVETRKVMLAK